MLLSRFSATTLNTVTAACSDAMGEPLSASNGSPAQAAVIWFDSELGPAQS